MEIQSIDQGRSPQRVQNVVVACSAHVIVETMQPTAARNKACHGCMASALGPLDVRPNFHVHDSTCMMIMCCVECCCGCRQPFKGEVYPKIKFSPVVVFWVLSRMVLVRGSCDAPFLLESQSNPRTSTETG